MPDLGKLSEVLSRAEACHHSRRAGVRALSGPLAETTCPARGNGAPVRRERETAPGGMGTAPTQRPRGLNRGMSGRKAGV